MDINSVKNFIKIKRVKNFTEIKRANFVGWIGEKLGKIFFINFPFKKIDFTVGFFEINLIEIVTDH
jgi:hypothetical protein